MHAVPNAFPVQYLLESNVLEAHYKESFALDPTAFLLKELVRSVIVEHLELPIYQY